LWSLVPPVAVEPPAVQDEAWPRSDIDRFILAKLEKTGLAPVKDASPRSLIRRIFFDLIGLPPAPEEADAFAAEPTQQRLAELVDRLLALPQFGERWGRHWLDVARFAESSGREFNFTYPHAWPYRNWVIDSLNADKPYDQFIREQIAGDLLPAGGEAYENERRLGTGFLAVGPKRHSAGLRDFRAEMVDDQIDTTMRAILGLTVACARCHDHKFDPIPTRDYYALAGVFQSTEPLYGTIDQQYSRYVTEVVPFGPDAAAKYEAAQAFDKRLAEAKKDLETKQSGLKKRELAEVAPPPDPDFDGSEKVKAALAALRSEVAEAGADLKSLEENRPPPPPYGFAVKEGEKPQNARIAIRGELGDLGDAVPRSCLSAVSIDGVEPPPDDASGRLQLAQWLTSRDNPLTARVLVNRVWHHLFGRGLVQTVDNFGNLGRPPSHPELLDTLADEFMEDGWSLKRLIRRIVTSRVYQLSTAMNESAQSIDPDNTHLWRANLRRLDAESLRDAILSVSGQLDLSRPEGSSVTGLGDVLVRGVPLEKLQPPSNHRSVYLPVIRDYLPEMFDLFDFPSPSLVSGGRATTTVPPQELFLQNSPLVIELSAHAAERVLDAAGDVEEGGVEYAYKLTLSRPPTHEEHVRAIGFIDEATKKWETAEKKTDESRKQAWAGLMQALMASAEFRYLVENE
jgi:hypothetical protein